MNYRCQTCGSTPDFDLGTMVCPVCWGSGTTGPPKGILEVVYTKEDLENLGPPYLPLPRESYPVVEVGGTPLIASKRLREYTGFPGLFLKDDTRNPTGSYKDRASWAVAAQAGVLGITDITVASTGNAGSSMAGIGAAAGLRVTLFISKSAPRAKLVQARMYGARLRLVDGGYDEAYDMALAHAAETRSLCRNTAYNPMTIEGKKTAAVEIVDQLGRAPDAVFVPCGDGVILAGIYRGFEDMVTLGRIDRVPKIYAVQAAGSSALKNAYDGGFEKPVEHTHTVADSIQVDVPRNGRMAVDKLIRYGGDFALVTDEEILSAQKIMASRAGVFAEPAAAASLAGFIKASDALDRDAAAVLLVTGSGLKDIDSAAAALDRDDGSDEITLMRPDRER